MQSRSLSLQIDMVIGVLPAGVTYCGDAGTEPSGHDCTIQSTPHRLPILAASAAMVTVR